MRSARDQRVGGALSERRHRVEHVGDLPEEDVVRSTQQDQLAGLRDVLCGRAPVDVAAGVALADAIEFPNDRYQPVPRDAQPLDDAVAIEQFQLRLARDLVGRLGGDHPHLRLGTRERHLDVEPRLPA